MLKVTLSMKLGGKCPRNLPDNDVRCGPFNSFLRIRGELREMHYGRLFENLHFDRWIG